MPGKVFRPSGDPAADALRQAFRTPVTPAVMATVVDDCHAHGPRVAHGEPDDPDSSTSDSAAALDAAHRHAMALEDEAAEEDAARASQKR